MFFTCTFAAEKFFLYKAFIKERGKTFKRLILILTRMMRDTQFWASVMMRWSDTEEAIGEPECPIIEGIRGGCS